MKKSVIFYLSLILIDFSILIPVHGQNPAPAPAQTKRILLMNGSIHIGDGKVIPNGALGFANGKINLVADATTIRINRAEYDTILDVSGKQIYPGLIALNTVLGLNEIESVRATHDMAETGMLNPSVRSIIAYNTDSKVIPTVRSNGVLLAQIVPKPSGNSPSISGQSSVVTLDAWNYEDAAYATDIGMHLHWPSMRINRSSEPGGEEKQRATIERNINEIEILFQEARSYAADPKPARKNIHLEAMRGLFSGSKKLFIHCNHAKDIIASIAFANKFGLHPTLVGAKDAHLVANLLKENNVSVILVETHRLPSSSDEAIDLPFALPGLLKKEGIPFAISVPEFWQVRNLSYQAGTAAAYGITREEAIEAITLSPARILGIDNTTGSLEEGKDANIIVCKGDLLDMRSSEVEWAYINGRSINLDNIQTQLDRKYRDKFELQHSR